MASCLFWLWLCVKFFIGMGDAISRPSGCKRMHNFAYKIMYLKTDDKTNANRKGPSTKNENHKKR